MMANGAGKEVHLSNVEDLWSELSRLTGDRFDLSLWKKGGLCEHPGCQLMAVFARKIGRDWSEFSRVCLEHASIEWSPRLAEIQRMLAEDRALRSLEDHLYRTTYASLD